MERVPQGWVVGGFTQTLTIPQPGVLQIDIRDVEFQNGAAVLSRLRRPWNVLFLRFGAEDRQGSGSMRFGK